MNYIKQYFSTIRPYQPASLKVWGGTDRDQILKLDWNESTAGPAPGVGKALEALLAEGNFIHLYPATENKKLLEALSGYLNMPEVCIQYFAGSDSLHEYIARGYIGAGDHVLIRWPSYDNFRLTAEAAGASVFYAECDENFSYAVTHLENEIQKIRPSFVYICNPENPTGACMTVETIETLVAKYPESMFLIDEAYSEFSGISAKELVLKYENILISRTMSKAFGLANLRFGYLIASRENIRNISRIRNPKNITTFAQTAALAALSDLPYMVSYVREVCAARKWFLEQISGGFDRQQLCAFPSQGNFVMIRCESTQLKQFLLAGLQKQGIIVRDLNYAESVRTCIRITIGTRVQMDYVYKILKKLTGQYRESGNIYG